ncbi:hypothetical protein TFLX_02615 [Thermoflexales bacterium]|nr:hypothetical protein TFLX_02615 [Thermoflexales bacterium]
MAVSPNRFAQLLTEGVYHIRHRESKRIQVVQDELGYALGRAGGSVIEYWRKGHLPATHQDIEGLARELMRRGGFDETWLTQFLASAGYNDPTHLYGERFPPPNPTLPSAARQELDEFVSSEEEAPQLAPFIVGPPILHPRQFFGREAELRAIFDLWRHDPLQNVAIIGQRRSGKTSLLHYLATISATPPSDLRPQQRRDWLPHPERYQWVFVDFQDARMHQQERLLHYMLTHLALPVPESCDLPTFLDIVSLHLCAPSIILMDEIAVGLAAPELDQHFWWSLRSLGTLQTHGQLGFVLAAQTVPAQIAQEYGKPSPFFNIFGHSFTLGPLLEEEALALIASAPLPFSPDDQDWILEHSGGWPYPLQLLCHLRLSALRNGDETTAWRTQALPQLTALTQEALPR